MILLFVDAPKVDMIILLLLVRTENNKFPPSENDGNSYIVTLSHLLFSVELYTVLRVAGRRFRIIRENQAFYSTY